MSSSEAAQLAIRRSGLDPARTPQRREPERDNLPWRAVILAAIAAWSVLDPYLSLRYGGAVAAILALTVGRRYRPGRSDVLAIALLALGALSNFWAAFPDRTLAATLNQLGAVGIFLGIRAVGTTRRNLYLIGLGFLAGGAYSILLLWQARERIAPGLNQDINSIRFMVEGVNQNYTAYALAVGAAVLLLLWRWSVRRRLSVLLLGYALIAAGIDLAGTRGAMLALGMLLAWPLVHRLRPSSAFSALVLASVVTLTLVAIGTLDDSMRPEREQGRETGDLNGRLAIWPFARHFIAMRPFFGWGIGAFRELNPYAIVAHNVILEIGVGLGLAGLILFACLLHSTLIRDTRTSTLNQRGRTLTVGALIAASLPIYLSGHWDQSAVAWVVVALFSRSSILQSESARPAWAHGQPTLRPRRLSPHSAAAERQNRVDPPFTTRAIRLGSE